MPQFTSEADAQELRNVRVTEARHQFTLFKPLLRISFCIVFLELLSSTFDLPVGYLS